MAPISAKGDTVERGRSLDQCPAHIIQAIAAFTEDERTIWSLMKTSRAVRRAAEGALKPYLAERKVTARPPFVTDSKSVCNVRLRPELIIQSFVLSTISSRETAPRGTGHLMPLGCALKTISTLIALHPVRSSG
jgi:hypothetical protein